MKKSIALVVAFFAVSLFCHAQSDTWRMQDIDEAYGYKIFIKKPSSEYQKSVAEQILIERKLGKYKRFNYSLDYSGNVKSRTISPFLDGYYYVLGECIIDNIAYVRLQTVDSATIFVLPKQFINKEMLWDCYSPSKIISFFNDYQFLEISAYNKVYKITDFDDRNRRVSIYKPYHQFGDKKYAKISIKELKLEHGALRLNSDFNLIYFQNPTIHFTEVDNLVRERALLTKEDIEKVKIEENSLLDSAKALYNPKENIKDHFTRYHELFKNGLVHLVGQEIMLCGYSSSNTTGIVYIIDSVLPSKHYYDPIQLCVTNKHNGESTIISGKASELNERYIVLSHIEKLKDSLVGKEYVYQYDGGSYGSPIKQVGSNNKMTEVPNKTIWKCIDVCAQLQLGNSVLYSANPFIVLQNDKYGQGYCYFSTTFNNEDPVFVYRMTEKQEYDAKNKADQKAKQERINKLSAKYGKYYAKLIAEGKVVRGMTKEMCKESWGEPDDINVSIGSWGRHEQWVYGEIHSSYLYFENGKLTAIQD